MKTVKFLLVILLCGLTGSVWSQMDARLHGLRFYEQLAFRDAAYEWELQKLDGQDELDYWTDQSNYERHLGKANFPAYLAYMKAKNEAYNTYLNECPDDCLYSELFLEKAKNYLSVSDVEFFTGKNLAQHQSRKIK